MSDHCKSDHCKSDHSCKVTGTNSSIYQTLDELAFERGIWYAAQTGDLPRVTKLFDQGQHLNAVDTAGYTALHYAARNGQSEVCKFLLSNNVDVNAKTRAGGATALQRACSSGQVAIVDLLLKNKADCKLQDNDGKNALHRAAESGVKSICEAIVRVCPSLKTELDRRGKKPADYAKTEELVKCLQ